MENHPLPAGAAAPFSLRLARIITAGAISLYVILCLQAISVHAAPPAHAGKTRTYYVAADEVQWDYAPSGRDEAMGMPFDDIAKGLSTGTGPRTRSAALTRSGNVSRVHRSPDFF